GAVFGRLCSFAAKKALEGYEIIVVNSEQAIMSGNKTNIAQKYIALRAQGGHSNKRPKYAKIPYRMVKRGIRGMLPDHVGGIGKQALSRVRCYEGVPAEFKDQKMLTIQGLNHSKYITIKELSERI
ncbi:MAG: 50S ribosomal protein L13, partial [archaeon]